MLLTPPVSPVPSAAADQKAPHPPQQRTHFFYADILLSLSVPQGDEGCDEGDWGLIGFSSCSTSSTSVTVSPHKPSTFHPSASVLKTLADIDSKMRVLRANKDTEQQFAAGKSGAHGARRILTFGEESSTSSSSSSGTKKRSRTHSTSGSGLSASSTSRSNKINNNYTSSITATPPNAFFLFKSDNKGNLVQDYHTLTYSSSSSSSPSFNQFVSHRWAVENETVRAKYKRDAALLLSEVKRGHN